MGKDVLEVHLVDARGLSGSDFLGKIDPYVIVQYRSQERKSSVARDQGRNPCWNEVFKFQINSSASSAQHKLILRIMDHDHFSSDDFLGEATIDVTDIISLGAEHGSYHMNAAKHTVVLADSTYHGEIKVGITFTAAQVRTTQYHASWRHWFGLRPVDFTCKPMPGFRLRKMMRRLEAGGTEASTSRCGEL
jgi:Ca2+-dependent lipid-binding protein